MHDFISLLMVLVPALPLAAAALVAVLGPHVLRGRSHWLVVVAIGISFLGSLVLLNDVCQRPNDQPARVVTLWNWTLIDGDTPAESVAGLPAAAAAADAPADNATSRPFQVDVSLRSDALTSIMLTMVTLVSFLVAVYSIGYMHEDRGYWRFFAYIGLFVFSMTSLVSVSNFLLLFVFWEAVGVCSYLLIGFWYEKPSAAAAGMKAFLVNRVGDFGFMLGVLLIWITYGTLNFHDVVSGSGGATIAGVLGTTRIAAGAYVGGGIGLAICLLLLLGACGKSAQFPLHVWLPDAMEGPSPVSALIHAATMVTAGIYMITRCTPLYMASPDGQLAVAAIGGFTALLAGLIALTQFDLKRVLAYSTISQLGYMFLGLGTGTLAGISAGMFHLFTHAFFKALLFLGAGSVMHAMGNVLDMRRFGGLRRRMPYTYWTFLIGCLALSGIAPFSGFWSKDAIVASVHAKVHDLNHIMAERQTIGESDIEPRIDTAAGDASVMPTTAQMSDAELTRAASAYQWLYYMAMFTAFLTALYTFRALYLTFFGREEIPPEAGHHAHESPRVMVVPLVVLAVFAAGVGALLDLSYLNGTHPFAALLAKTPSLTGAVANTETLGTFHTSIAAISMLIAIAGVLVATYLYLGDRREVVALQEWMDFQPLIRWTDGDVITRLGRQPWARAVRQAADRLWLGWLFSAISLLLSGVLLVISAPLLVGRLISPYRMSYRKFFFDEIYNALIVVPLRAFATLNAIIDDWLIDGIVNLAGRIPLMFGSLLRSMQTGLVQFYALAMVLGGVVLLLAVDQHLSGPISQWLHHLLAFTAGVGP